MLAEINTRGHKLELNVNGRGSNDGDGEKTFEIKQFNYRLFDTYLILASERTSCFSFPYRVKEVSIDFPYRIISEVVDKSEDHRNANTSASRLLCQYYQHSNNRTTKFRFSDLWEFRLGHAPVEEPFGLFPADLPTSKHSRDDVLPYRRIKNLGIKFFVRSSGNKN